MKLQSILSICLALSAAVVWAVAPDDQPSPALKKPVTNKTTVKKPVTNRPIEVPANGYVSSKACKSCHFDQYTSWHATYHRTMTQVVTKESVLGDFENVELDSLDRTELGWKYRLQRQGDKFWVEIEKPLSSGPPLAADLLLDGEEPPKDLPPTTIKKKPSRQRRQIVLSTGSHRLQAYWFETGNSRDLKLLPFMYDLRQQQWIPRDAKFLKPPNAPWPDEMGRWSSMCINCHATNGRPRLRGPKDIDTQVSEFGIACEACHGPGEEHVRIHQDRSSQHQLLLGKDPDMAIVQPEHLRPHLSSQVCGQCHSVSMYYKKEVADRWSEHGFHYRPGQDLAETRFFPGVNQSWKLPIQKEIMQWVLKKEPHFFTGRFWSDGMIRIAGREYNGLLESPCYKHGDEKKGMMSCFSCHSLHKQEDDPRTLKTWANDLLKNDMQGNQACTQCHQDYAETVQLAAHSHHSPDSSGSLCYNCHMPHTTYGLLSAIRSHQIDSPSVSVSLQTGRPNACNLCHLDQTLQWTATNLAKWYKIPEPSLTHDEQTIAASLLWLLSGDAGQRALLAWSMGWQPALDASSKGWQAPFLAQLLEDPYDAVRYVAHESLQRQPGFSGFAYNFVAPKQQRSGAKQRALEVWKARRSERSLTANRELLIGPQGRVIQGELKRLLQRRNDRRLYLRE